MKVRVLVLCVLLLGAALGAAGCSSSGSASGAPSGGKPTGQPGGTVTVKSGNKVVCVITLDKDGTGTCKVNTKDYAPGKITYTGTYNGGGGFKAGSGSTTLTV